jgi:hypothetical protein
MMTPFPSSFLSFFFFWHTHCKLQAARTNQQARKQAATFTEWLAPCVPACLRACHHLMPGFGVNQCGNWIRFHTLFISMM